MGQEYEQSGNKAGQDWEQSGNKAYIPTLFPFLSHLAVLVPTFFLFFVNFGPLSSHYVSTLRVLIPTLFPILAPLCILIPTLFSNLFPFLPNLRFLFSLWGSCSHFFPAFFPFLSTLRFLFPLCSHSCLTLGFLFPLCSDFFSTLFPFLLYFGGSCSHLVPTLFPFFHHFGVLILTFCQLFPILAPLWGSCYQFVPALLPFLPRFEFLVPALFPLCSHSCLALSHSCPTLKFLFPFCSHSCPTWVFLFPLCSHSLKFLFPTLFPLCSHSCSHFVPILAPRFVPTVLPLLPHFFPILALFGVAITTFARFFSYSSTLIPVCDYFCFNFSFFCSHFVLTLFPLCSCSCRTLVPGAFVSNFVVILVPEGQKDRPDATAE